MSSNDIIKIDVEAILKSRASKTKVPKFLVNYLRKIAHEDEFNQFFRDHAGLKNLDFVEAAFNYLAITLKIEGEENLPPIDGKYIFASNHPLGGLDGVATGYVIGKHYNGKMRFFSNDLVTFLTPMRDLFIPINKFGAQSKQAAEMMHQFYESDNQLVTYPAGVCSRKTNGRICDLAWKKNFITKAIEYKRDVVPVYFEGQNSKFFYNLANLRKFLGIKFNIEMMYLADEMFKQKNKEFVIKIGKPIPWQTFDKSKSHTKWAEWVKGVVYSL